MWARGERDDRHLRLLLAFALDGYANCIDVGANEGAVLDHMIRVAPLGTHMAFEPLGHLANELRRRFPQVDVRDVALSDVTGTAPFVHVVNAEAYSGLREQRYRGSPILRTTQVQTARLDDVIGHAYVPSLIKIDVEGAERDVIAGGIETIARHRPIVVFEHYQGAAPYYGAEPQNLYELLVQEAGLRIFDIDGHGPYTLTGMEDRFERQDLWMFVARP